METMGMRLSVIEQSFPGPPGQYGRWRWWCVTSGMNNGLIVEDEGDHVLLEEWLMVLLLETEVMMCYQWNK